MILDLEAGWGDCDFELPHIGKGVSSFLVVFGLAVVGGSILKICIGIKACVCVCVYAQ